MYHLHLSALSVGRCAFHVFPPSARRCHRWAVSAAPWRGVSPGTDLNQVGKLETNMAKLEC